MRERLNSLGRPAILLAIVLVALTMTLATLWVFGVGNQGGSAQPGEPERGGRWGTTNRDRLAICIDTVNVAAGTRTLAKTEMEDMLTQLAGDPFWPEYNKGFLPPLVDEGCPSPPVLYDPEARPPAPLPETISFVRGRAVSAASYYYLHVYVIPREDMDRYGPGRFTSEEYFCHGDSCSGVTTGLYISPDDFEDRQSLSDLVAKAIGLRRTGN